MVINIAVNSLLYPSGNGSIHLGSSLPGLFTKRLKLNGEQQKVVRNSLDQSFKEMKPIRRRIQPELKAVRERAREKIRKVLTAAQREKYDQMVRRYEARRAKRFL